MPLYADIVLPLAQPAYTFAVPEGMHVEAGQAVAVQFGARKFYTGIVWRVHDRRPPFKTVKSIQRVLYGAPLLSAQQMAFWEWVAAYYMCTPGEVMRVGLPSLMKPSGDTEEEFTEEEFRPRTECYVALAPGLHDEGRLHEAFEKLERRAPRQYEALLELASAGDGERIPTGEVARRLLRADYAVLHALERKGYIVSAERERTVERRRIGLPPAGADPGAARGAGVAAGAVRPEARGVAARHYGVGQDRGIHPPDRRSAGAGRRRAAAGARDRPHGAADRTHGAHFRQPCDHLPLETYEPPPHGDLPGAWNRSQGGEFVVGVRSSIFLPLKRLQLVVVDEEHDAQLQAGRPCARVTTRATAPW